MTGQDDDARALFSFERIVEALRDDMVDGRYRAGDFLPTHQELTARFGVSRPTVVRAMRALAEEGLIETRQGSRSKVAGRGPGDEGERVIHSQSILSWDARPGGASLRDFVEPAFEADEVRLDVATLSSESLARHLLGAVARIKGAVEGGRTPGGPGIPSRISVRMMLPVIGPTLAYPRNALEPDDPRPLKRLGATTDRYTGAIRDALDGLRVGKYVPEVEMSVRKVPVTPTEKLYLLNGTEILRAPYEVVRRRMAFEDGDEIEAFDVLGYKVDFFHLAKGRGGPDSAAAQFIDAEQRRFDSLWEHLAVDAHE